MSESMIHDDRRCELGEGPFWHPTRGQLFWFDILNRRLMSRSAEGPLAWEFPTIVSCGGWIDETRLFLCSEAAFLCFDLATGGCEEIAPLDAGNRATRSNDGRADPWGGFWVGTMGKKAEPEAGAIWRYHRGEVRCLFPRLTITNAISFAPDGGHACFTDTRTRQVMRVRLGPDGWPEGEAEVFIDLRAEGLNPDGATFDALGNLWLAQWGAGRVACHGPDGRFRDAVHFPARQTSCPAFGGAGLSTLYCTSAMEGMDAAAREADPKSGMTFAAETGVTGQAEHRVIL